MADMMAGAIRLHAMNISSEHFYYISSRVVDLWELPLIKHPGLFS